MNNTSKVLPTHHGWRYHYDVKVIKLTVDNPYGFPYTLDSIDGDKFSPLVYAFKIGGRKDIIDFILGRIQNNSYLFTQYWKVHVVLDQSKIWRNQSWFIENTICDKFHEWIIHPSTIFEYCIMWRTCWIDVGSNLRS